MCCQLKAKSHWVGLVPSGASVAGLVVAEQAASTGGPPQWRVHSIFTRVINLTRIHSQGPPQFISLVLPEVGGGFNRLVLDPSSLGVAVADLRDLPLTTGDPVTREGLEWKIGPLVLDFTTSTPWNPGSRQKFYVSPAGRLVLQRRVRQMTKQVPNLDHWFEATPFGSLQQERFQKFFADPTPKSAERILGLGPGLTPLGDDCLVGHLMALSVLGRSLTEYADVAANASPRTTDFSAFTLREAYEGQFSVPMREFIAEVFHPEEVDDFPSLQKILAQGSSSGPGIGWGFFRTLKKYEKEVEYAYLYPNT